MPRKKSTSKKLTLYQKVSKKFTALNNKLPEEQKLSIQRRRQLIKQGILPALSTTPKSKIRLKQIDEIIKGQIALIPTRDPNLCNLNYISPSQYQEIEWFEIDEFLQRRLPDCIYVKVNAGSFGSTKIFNTRNYNYYFNGVQQITENIRKEVDNASGSAFYSGRQMLRPKMKNDGKADSYYLDLVLYMQPKRGTAMPLSPLGKITRYTGKNEQETKSIRKASTKVNNKLDKLLGKLTKEKEAKGRAFRQIKKDDKKITKIVNKKVTPRNEFKLIEDFAKSYERAKKKLDNYLAKGLISKAKYDKAMESLKDNYNKFNES
jgi:hypothetical protein